MDPNIIELAREKKPEFQKALVKWASSHMREFPWRKKMTPYKVLLAEVLLRRTTASAVLRIYEKAMRSYPTIEDLANADRRELEALLSSVGYHRQRAKILKDIATFIVREYRGEIPRSVENLLQIPHVGPYITGAILSFGYDIPAAMVDSNVERILKRAFCESLPAEPSLRTIQDLAETLVPRRGHQTYNFGLLDLGALICRYDVPRCMRCPLCGLCDYGLKHRGEHLV